MSNKVLVTGLGVGQEFGVCSACNSNFSWLINNPSVLIWADKIYITPKIWEVIMKGDKDSDKDDSKFGEAVRVIMNIADSYGVIEIVDPKEVFDESYGDVLYDQASRDQEKMLLQYNHVKLGSEDVPGEMYIADNHYCTPYIASIYASMSIADHLGANCLFHNDDMTYINHKFGLQVPNISNTYYNKAFSEIFSIVLPDELVLHNYAFSKEEDCDGCRKYVNCNDKYLIDIEKNTKKMMKWREYDSIYQARDVIDKLAKNKGEIITQSDVNEVIGTFEEKIRNINININSRFPKIKRWTNLATLVSVPAALITLSTGNPEAAIASATIAGTSTITNELIKYYTEKNNWVGFMNK
jgi:hypothetical protein